MGKERPTREKEYGKLEIVKNGARYVLPAFWSLSDVNDFDVNAKLQDRAFSHGSDYVGDGKFSGRTIKIEFNMNGATEEEHDEAVNLAYSHFAQRDYDLYAGRGDRVYHVAGLSKIKQKFIKGFKQRKSEITVSLHLTDPFRYAASPTKVNITYEEAQEEAVIEISNPSAVDVPLIWSFTPPEGASTPDISISHVESGQSFSLKDTLLTAPAVATVNAENGTVRRDTGNSLNTFSGVFLHALAGTNTFKYSGAPCNITITYTPRWFV